MECFGSNFGVTMVQTADGRCRLFTVAIVDGLLYGCRLLATGTRKHGVIGTNKRSGYQCGFVEVEVEPYTTHSKQGLKPIVVILQDCGKTKVVFGPPTKGVAAPQQQLCAPPDENPLQQCINEMSRHVENMPAGADQTYFLAKLSQMRTVLHQQQAVAIGDQPKVLASSVKAKRKRSAPKATPQRKTTTAQKAKTTKKRGAAKQPTQQSSKRRCK